MTNNSKALLPIISGALIIGLIAGIGVTSRYYRRHATQHIDTVYVERTIEVNTTEAEQEQLPSAGIVSIPKEMVSSCDSSTISIKRDSVRFTGVEPVSGASYEVVVSGVRPDLNRLRMTIPEQLLTKTVTRPLNGWSLGIFTDAYYFNQLDARAGLYASYTAGPFCIHLDVGAMYSNIGPNKAVNPFIGAGIKIQLYQNK